MYLLKDHNILYWSAGEEGVGSLSPGPAISSLAPLLTLLTTARGEAIRKETVDMIHLALLSF